jgi:hypothetical protein
LSTKGADGILDSDKKADGFHTTVRKKDDMAAKRNAVATKRKPRGCQPMELSEVEWRLLEAIVSFHGRRVKALQELTRQFSKAKKRPGPLFTSPGGRQISKHILAVVAHTKEMNQLAAGMMHRLCEGYRIPAGIRRSLSRMATASVTRITNVAGTRHPVP